MRSTHMRSTHMGQLPGSSGSRQPQHPTLLLVFQPCLPVPLCTALHCTAPCSADLDIEEPLPTVKSLVTAFEGLRGTLAASGGDCRAVLMQEAFTCLLGRVLSGGWVGGWVVAR